MHFESHYEGTDGSAESFNDQRLLQLMCIYGLLWIDIVNRELPNIHKTTAKFDWRRPHRTLPAPPGAGLTVRCHEVCYRTYALFDL